MGNFLETIYDVLFNPKTAMQVIADKKLIGQAFAMFTIGMLVPVWAVYTGIRATQGIPAVGFLFVLHFIGSLLLWIMGACVLHFIAELAGGRGTAVGLFAALGFAHLPRIAAIPLGVIAALLPDGLRGVAFGVIGLLIVIWTLSLDVAAIRGAHGLSAAKAVLVLAAPLLVLIGGIVVVVVFLGSTLLQLPFHV
ncbi:YIP1 family protein [Sporomusa acidovorans]|uniref:Yip1 domain-containing protein n=1 Tax=Sporomusa acidovorans (strain ATCC 49682 / DSM 3132 / Mol) TaxID=1123286 RepID=A0ABZ3IX28_SPOA4|nr:YIP1 family protein [Sporomusa acidovorans]OZC23631.1 Yip1 domain protein [Sporomusa acidovorans DSM 3132]SDE23166.1 Yip1 domain-containing protein [Sporomusa acidovorans]